MRVLYLSFSTSPKRLVTDHSTGWANAIFRRWIDRDPNISVYWTVPRNAPSKQRDAFYKFTDEELKKNIKFIEVPVDITQIMEQSNYPKKLIDLFTLYHGKYYFDIIICEKPGMLGWLFNNWLLYKFRRDEILLVNNIHYSMSTDDNISIAREFEATFYANLVMGDVFLFGNSTTADSDSLSHSIKNAKKYIAPSQINKLINSPCFNKLQTDVEELRNVKDTGKGEGFRIHFGFSISTYFEYKTLRALLGRFTSIIPDLRWVITTPSGSLGRGGEKPEKWMELHLSCPRKEFYKIAKRSHCFIFWSKKASGLSHGSVIEMARLGVVPIFQKDSFSYPWCEEWKDYPLAFETDEELLALLKYVKLNYGKKKIKDIIKRNCEIIDNFDKKCGPDAMIDKFIELKNNRPHYQHSAFSELLNEFPDKISLKEALSFIRGRSDVGHDLDDINFVTQFKVGLPADLRWYMLSHGWKDIGDVNEVVFERV